MSITPNSVSVPAKRSGRTMTIHDLAIWSVFIYIVCSIVFEFTAVSITALSSYSLYLCLGCCVLDCINNNRIRLNWTIGVLALFGLLIWISCIYTPASEIYTQSRMYRYWTSLILMFLIICVKPDNDDIVKLLNAFVIAGTLLAIYIYSFYGLDELMLSGERLQNGDFGNVNIVGMHCTLSAILAIYLMVAQKKNKLYCILSFVCCLPCIMFSGSRKALIILIVCLVVFVFLYTKSKRPILGILLTGLVVFGIVTIVNVVPAFEPIKERMLGTFEFLEGGEATVEGDLNRMMYLEVGLKSFLEKPIFGYGFCYSYHIFGTYSHNNYVELLMCHGIVGFVIYYGMIVKLLYDCYFSDNDRKFKILVYIILLKMLMEDIGSVTYYNRINFVILAMLVCCIQKKKISYERTQLNKT